MDLPVKATIDELGLAEMVRASGFPASTLWRWREENRIPGKGTAHALKVSQFVSAAEKVRAQKRVEAA